MLYEKHKRNLQERLSGMTDQELRSLELKSTKDGEVDCARACSEILLQRRNRVLDSDTGRGRIGFTDGDFDN